MADGKPTQRITNFDALYQQAKESQPLYEVEMNEYLTQLRERYPGVFDNVRFEQGPLKTRDRALAKINGDYDGQTNRIADLVRGRFVVETAQQADILRKDIVAHAPFKVEKFKDQFAEPLDTQFRAINAQIRLSNGHLAEFRVEHAGMLQASLGTHKPYEEMQALERRVNAEHRDYTPTEEKLRVQLRDQIGAALDHAAVEAKLDPLLNAKGRAEVDAFRQRMGMSIALPPLMQAGSVQIESGLHQNPVPIIVPQGERAPHQNPVPLIVTQNERNQPPAPFVWRQPPPVEVPPERVTVPGKIGIGGAVAQLAIGPVYEATLSAANDGSMKDIARAGGRGLANAALPGVTDGFKNITENNQHQNWVDQTLNAGTTATQGVAVGSLAVAGGSAAAAPVTGGASLTVTAGSLVVAGVSGVANLGIGLVHDATYVTGISKQGGVVTGLINMGSQLLDSKAAHRAGDWIMGNDAKVQQELAAKGVRPNQLAGVDANKDGKVSAQEARDYLVQHHVPADQVNSLAAKPLADRLASAVAPQHPAPQAAAHPKPAMSDDMQRALQAALKVDLSSSILCDTRQHKPASEWHAPMLPPKAQGNGVCR